MWKSGSSDSIDLPRLRTAVLVITALGILGALWLLSLDEARAAIFARLQSLTTSPDRRAYLHLVLPASSADANVCKTLYSATVVGYPSPVLVNWEKKFEDDTLVFGGSHIAKISGVLEYLQRLGKRYDNDVLLVVDSLDVWFQLRPSVLLQRYHDINRAADVRLQNDFREVSLKRPFRQNIIFSAQKRCWPKPPENPACWAVPNSTLPADVFGEMTDSLLDENDPNPYENVRPRYLNSGMIMGEVAALRVMFERALQKSIIDSNFGSDQNIFAEIFGEQEFQRAALLDPSLVPENKSERQTAHEENNTIYEFGIGLDYDGKLVPPTVFAEFDNAWIQHDQQPDAEIMRSLQEKHQRSGLKPQVDLDIQRSEEPDTVPLDEDARVSSWNSVPLHTNILTGIAPVGIHHNAHRLVDGVSLKERRISHWDKTWFFGHLRSLLTREARSPFERSSSIVGQDGRALTYWNHGRERAGVYIPRLQMDFESLEDICRGTEEEVLRDGQGPWLDPRRQEHFP